MTTPAWPIGHRQKKSKQNSDDDNEDNYEMEVERSLMRVGDENWNNWTNQRMIDTSTLPPDLEMKKHLLKYYYQRYHLFSRFDDGVKMDEESWYSVTPERIAIHQAKKFHSRIGYNRHAIYMDPFVGAGGNLIQLACVSPYSTVIGCDLNEKRLKIAKHNARVYGVQNQCQFIIADYCQLVKCIIRPDFIDAIFFSPQWGGVNYRSQEKYSLNMMQPNGYEILHSCREYITHNIAIFVPRNTDFRELKDQLLTKEHPMFEYELNLVGRNKVKAKTLYWGDLIDPTADCEAADSNDALE